ncbi:MAG: dethiobiotin synthase [Candidatus Omnitrophota bacterium]|nr:dethiobiotin synthase [Candidatus Omnitrophota bacterium]
MSRALKGLFITGTDTGVGKTVITGLLARYYQEKNQTVITQKWVQTGSSRPVDYLRHRELAGLSPADAIDISAAAAGYCFRRAASPHLAARLEKKKISSRLIRQRFNTLAKKFDLVIVEGAGGALVPFDRKHLLLDIACRLKLPVVIVARNALGAINHALVTIEAIRSRKIPIAGIIFNCCDKKVDRCVVRDNPRIVAQLGKTKVLGSLPYTRHPDLLYVKFKPVARAIEKALCRMI